MLESCWPKISICMQAKNANFLHFRQTPTALPLELSALSITPVTRKKKRRRRKALTPVWRLHLPVKSDRDSCRCLQPPNQMNHRVGNAFAWTRPKRAQTVCLASADSVRPSAHPSVLVTRHWSFAACDMTFARAVPILEGHAPCDAPGHTDDETRQWTMRNRVRSEKAAKGNEGGLLLVQLCPVHLWCLFL